MAFQFPNFDESKRAFRSLGLAPDEIEIVLAEQYGLTMGLQKNFPDRVVRGNELMAPFKALYAFEHYGRDCSYAQIGDTLEVSPETAYVYMATARDAVRICFGLEILSQKDQVRLVQADDLRERTTRFVQYIQDEVEPRMAKIKKFTASLKRANQSVLLPPKAAAYLQASTTPDGDYVQV
jgi:hypothetical protein